MKRKPAFLFTIVLIFTLACQFLFPTQSGTVITTCADLTAAIRGVQPRGDIPQNLMEDGVKTGGEFDASTYFTALSHLSMQEGYALDYVYLMDFIGGGPDLIARPVDLPPYTSYKDLTEDTALREFTNFIVIDDTEEGYFEFATFSIMANQFYLYWHANYNDTQIVCSRDDVDLISDKINQGDFGYKFDLSQQAKIAAMKNIEPVVRLDGNNATVELTTFTKWGGFYRETFIIERAFPHTIVDVQFENIVPYDCGVMY